MTTVQEQNPRWLYVNGIKYPIPKEGIKLSRYLETLFSGKFSDENPILDFEDDALIGFFIVYSYLVTVGKTIPIFNEDNFLAIVVVADFLEVEGFMNYLQNYVESPELPIPEDYMIFYKHYPFLREPLRKRLVKYVDDNFAMKDYHYRDLAAYIDMKRDGDFVYSPYFPVTERKIPGWKVDANGNFLLEDEVKVFIKSRTTGKLEFASVPLTEITTRNGVKYYCINVMLSDKRYTTKKRSNFTFIYIENGIYLVLKNAIFKGASDQSLLAIHKDDDYENYNITPPVSKRVHGVFKLDHNSKGRSKTDIKDNNTGFRIYFSENRKSTYYGYISASGLDKFLSERAISKDVLLKD